MVKVIQDENLVQIFATTPGGGECFITMTDPDNPDAVVDQSIGGWRANSIIDLSTIKTNDRTNAIVIMSAEGIYGNSPDFRAERVQEPPSELMAAFKTAGLPVPEIKQPNLARKTIEAVCKLIVQTL